MSFQPILSAFKTVYIRDNQLLFVAHQELVNVPSGITHIITHETNEDLEKLIESLQTSQAIIVCTSDNIEATFDAYLAHYTIIDAGGGLVQNEKGEYLFIYRNETWDLPKGKIEKGESKEEGAVREVQEECGLKEVHLSSFLAETYHTYKQKNKQILKRTTWYHMKASSTEVLHPQLEEDITDIQWFGPDHFEMIKGNTYHNIKDILYTISQPKVNL